MTNRLYYGDSYTRAFTARVVERARAGGRPAVVLDRTYFYPASGGQPFDRGNLNGVPVVEVAARPGDGAVLHVLAGELEAGEVRGEIDWPRRFDHMQQHTGQHILSQAFSRVAGAETVSFHLSEDSVTIDLAGGVPAASLVAEAEALACRVVLDNVPVRAWFPGESELQTLSLRRAPEGLAAGALRVIAIGDFDFSACGGTHVARAGEIGLIKVVKVERRGGEARVEFRCGWRALEDYGRKNDIVNSLAAAFTCAPGEVAAAVSRLQAEAQASRRALKAAQDELIEQEALRLAESSRAASGWRVIRREWASRPAAELRALAARLAAHPNTIALLGASGGSAHLVLGRADGPESPAGPDMREALKAALALLGAGRGGGSPALAQGGGPAAGPAEVEAALAAAERQLGLNGAAPESPGAADH
jgi:alanyl-tRNA synthetase